MLDRGRVLERGAHAELLAPGVATPRCGGGRRLTLRGRAAARSAALWLARRRTRDRSSSPGLTPARMATMRAEACCIVIVRSSRELAHERAQPLEQRDPAVLETGEEREVDERPHQPADESADLDALEAHDRAEARDRRHAPQIAIHKRLRGGIAAQTPFDRAGSVDPRLHRHLGDARKPVQRHHVADRRTPPDGREECSQGGLRRAPRGRCPAPVACASMPASGDACTPADQTFVWHATRSSPSGPATMIASGLTSVTRLRSRS